MNKKVLITAIAVSTVCIAVILAVVLLGNSYRNGNSGKKRNPDKTSEETITQRPTDNGKNKDFLQDPEFLDSEQPHAKNSENADEESFSLLVSSVKNDIRITILDKAGHIAAGKAFEVAIKDIGNYKDIDCDGMIYIGGLRAGKYELELVAGNDYPKTAPVSISVHDSLEYEELADISYLIKTEDEIDALTEDTKKTTADVDDTQKTTPWKRTDEAKLGIDVSKWNKEIDFQKVKEAGIEFVIIRIGYRGSKTGVLVEDPYFYKNLKGAKEAGLLVGVYFFTQAINETEAIEEASAVLSLLGDETLDYPIFIDTESSGGRADSLDVATRTAVCDAFCKTIEKNGYHAGVYASRSWFYNKLNDDKLSAFVRWLAEYREKPLYTGKYEIWQYTSNGSVPGIEGRVDLNQSYIEIQERE